MRAEEVLLLPGAGAGAGKKKKRSRTASESRCQVEGCGADLSTGKSYHFRHRVCESHSKSPAVVVAGRKQRFCQQCSRFHDLGEFDEDKRSCRRRLAGHNQRRRKPAPNLTTLFHYPTQTIAASSYGEHFSTGIAIERSSMHFNSAKPIGADGCDAFVSQMAAASPGLTSFSSNPGTLSLHPTSNIVYGRRLQDWCAEPGGQILSLKNGCSDDGGDAENLSGTSDSGRALCLLSKGWSNVGINSAPSMNQKPFAKMVPQHLQFGAVSDDVLQVHVQPSNFFPPAGFVRPPAVSIFPFPRCNAG